MASLATRALLQVDRIVVRGTERLSNGEVLAVLDGLRGENIVLERSDSPGGERLLTSPWVADATLRRSLPGTVEVRIAERHPLAIGRVGEELFLVDDHGRVIDEYGPRYADFDLPIIDGLAHSRRRAGQRGARAQLAPRLIASLRPRPDLARRISQLDVSGTRATPS